LPYLPVKNLSAIVNAQKNVRMNVETSGDIRERPGVLLQQPHRQARQSGFT